MMETKFTSGPWTAEQGQGFHTDQIVISAPSMNARSPLARVSNITEDAWPDARLIAAAPELYEALKNLTDNIETAFPSLASLGPVTTARAALSKARGAS